MMKHSFFICFGFSLIIWKPSFGQTLPSNVTINTPEVSAFNKNIETPVSMYTGVPDISIPLYTIKIKDVSVPITLDYHAGGIRVDQDATWVGLGWDLNYGGQITRKVRGIPDEKWFFKTNKTVDYFNNLPVPTTSDNIITRASELRNAKYGNEDYMPDEFYYSSLGYSGKFMYSQTLQKFVLFPHEDIAVSETENSMPFYSWNLLLPNGVSVDYGEEATTTQTTSNNPATTTKNSWMIKAIHNVDNDVISYTYENFSYNLWKITGENFQILQSSNSPNSVGNSVVQYQYSDARVKTISFPNGTINFITIPRSDMQNKALSEIDVLDLNGNLVRKILFSYSYFSGMAYDILPVLNSGVNSEVFDKYARLRLDSVSICGNDVAPMTYRFDYYYTNSTQAPSKYSFAQDHYGFYNGKANTGEYSFIPNFFPPGGNSKSFQGGDRRVNPNVSNVFSLHDITYRVGGKTEFIYENNTCNLLDVPNDFLETYQDDNLKETTAGISVSGYGMQNFTPAPTFIDQSGIVYYQKQFTVSANAYSAIGIGFDINTNYGIDSYFSNYSNFADNVYFKLEKLNSNGTYTLVKDFNTTPSGQSGAPYSRIGTYSVPFNIVPGATYLMTVGLYFADQNNDYNPYANHHTSFNITWREMDTTKWEVYTGGLRIKTINYYDRDGNIALTKQYKYANPNINPNHPDISSGRAISFPKYFNYVLKQSAAIPGSSYGSVDYGINFYSNSVIPLETLSGSYSGYEYVDEYDVDNSNPNNNLRTNYRFSFSKPYFSQFYGYNRFGLYEPNEWTRGKLLCKKYYKGSNIIKQEDYTYNTWSPHLTDLTQEESVKEINTDLISYQLLNYTTTFTLGGYDNSFSTDFYDDVDGQDPGVINYQNIVSNAINNPPQYHFYYGIYSNYNTDFTVNNGGISYAVHQNLSLPYFIHYSGFDKPMSETVTNFDDLGNKVIQTVNYTYGKTPTLYEVTQTQTTNSKGENLTTQLQYPADYSGTSPYNTMLQRHILNPVILKSDLNNSSLIQRTQTNYLDWGNNIIEPSSIMVTIGSNAPETRDVYDAYDSKGNILSMSKMGDIKTVYLWGYQSQYPVAKIIGSTYSAVSNIVSQSQIDASSGDDATLRSVLNNLRTGLNGAQVSTYTYAPLIGMTSATDLRGSTNYFEYDGLGRLKVIRDKDQNILKKFCYNLYGQPYSCSSVFYNDALSGTYHKLGCSSGYVGSNVTYTVPANTYSSTTSKADANTQAQNDINTNGQNYANTNGTCISNTCSFMGINGFTIPSSGFYNNGTTVSGYLVFYSSSTLSPGSLYQIGFVYGACKPGVIQNFSYTSGGRTFNFTVDSGGQLTVQLSSGSSSLSPNTSVSISFSYTY